MITTLTKGETFCHWWREVVKLFLQMKLTDNRFTKMHQPKIIRDSMKFIHENEEAVWVVTQDLADDTRRVLKKTTLKQSPFGVGALKS